METLHWWRDRCNEWCYARLENGRYGDQLYLNDWTERFRRVAVLKHIGAGTAPWNHDQYTFQRDHAKRIMVNEYPLIFYHFHSLVFITPEIIVLIRFLQYSLTQEILLSCFLPYVRELSQQINIVRSILPDFTFGLFTQGVLSAEHMFLANKICAPQLATIELKQNKIHIDDDWDCYCSGQYKGVQQFQRTPESGFSDDDHPLKLEAEEPLIHDTLIKEIEKIHKLLDLKKFEEAERAITHAMGKYPDAPDLNTLQALLKFRMGDKKGAESILTSLITCWPENFAAYNILACIYWQSGDFESAQKYFEDALKISHYDRAVVLSYGNMLFNLKKFERAKSIYEKYFDNHPDDSEIRSFLQKIEGILGKIGKMAGVVKSRKGV
jgi:tetratricopeptide (TPR) repeat protein